MITFLSDPPPLLDVYNFLLNQNPIPMPPKYSYLPGSALVVFFISIAPNKQFSMTMIKLLVLGISL